MDNYQGTKWLISYFTLCKEGHTNADLFGFVLADGGNRLISTWMIDRVEEELSNQVFDFCAVLNPKSMVSKAFYDELTEPERDVLGLVILYLMNRARLRFGNASQRATDGTIVQVPTVPISQTYSIRFSENVIPKEIYAD